MKTTYYSILFSLFLIGSQANAQNSCFVTGVDLSYTIEVEKHGGVFRDKNGVQVDPYVFYVSQGATLLRQRMFHTPENILDVDGNQITQSNLEYVKQSAKRIINAKADFLLNLHYADYFNHPGEQMRPKAWQNLTGEPLLKAIEDYTYNSLVEMYNNGTVPTIITIGNESNWGFVDPWDTYEGQPGDNNNNKTDGWSWENGLGNLDGQKYARAFKAVDDFNTDYKANVKKSLFLTADGFYNVIDGDFAANGITNYDIFGFSFYPGFQDTWSKAKFETELDSLLNYYATTSNADSGKKVLCIETGNRWTTSENDSYSNFMNTSSSADFNTITKQGQLDFMNYMNTTLKNKGLIGNIYWEPGWISQPAANPLADLWGHGSSYEDVALFDFNGNALPAWDAFSACYTCNDNIQNGDETGVDCGGSCPLSCTSSINENEYNAISIYPNPAEKAINITFEGSYSVQIYTLSGVNVYESKDLKNTSSLNISTLESGFYIIEVNYAEGTYVRKIIVE